MSDRLLMIVLDAAAPARVESLMRAGELPAVAELAQGSYRRVQSTADWWVASPWPSFYTGLPPSQHGFYYYLWWDPQTLESARPARTRFTAVPFWRSMPKGLRTIVIDGSEMHPPLEGDNIELSGWRTHDILSEPWIYPETLAREFAKHGWKPAPLVESYRPLRRADILKARRDLSEATESVVRIAELLLRREPWDFALVSLTAPHMGGHQLWSETSLAPDAEPDCAALQSEALDETYRECDRAVARILDAGHKASNLIVCSLHGMEHNRNRGTVLQEMLGAILGDQRSAVHGDTGVVGGLRSLIPEWARHAVKSRLPMRWQDRLTGYWRTGGYDWARTRAFSFTPDLQGYVRINLQGRERHGIVDRAEYESLIEEIQQGLMEFRDADDGERVVKASKPLSAFQPRDELRAFMPDIAINWAETPAAKHERILGPNGQSIAWPLPGRNSDGRSGNHSDEGFLIGRGPAFSDAQLSGWSAIEAFSGSIRALFES